MASLYCKTDKQTQINLHPDNLQYISSIKCAQCSIENDTTDITYKKFQARTFCIWMTLPKITLKIFKKAAAERLKL
jgi:hypothetical protein